MSKCYKPINSKYISTTGITHNRTLLSTKLDSIDSSLYNSNDYMMIGNLINDSWYGGSPGVVPYKEVIRSKGSKLSYSNYGIKIGAGVSLVRVSAQIVNDVDVQGYYLFGYIYKNNTQMSKNIFPLLR